jgi:glycopeptide antibiotics resistance protein
MISIAGLALIIAGWAVQVYKTLGRKERNLSLVFLALYGIGCVLLLAGNFLAKDITTGILNTISAILAAILFTTLLTGKKAA